MNVDIRLKEKYLYDASKCSASPPPIIYLQTDEGGPKYNKQADKCNEGSSKVNIEYNVRTNYVSSSLDASALINVHHRKLLMMM